MSRCLSSLPESISSLTSSLQGWVGDPAPRDIVTFNCSSRYDIPEAMKISTNQKEHYTAKHRYSEHSVTF